MFVFLSVWSSICLVKLLQRDNFFKRLFGGGGEEEAKSSRTGEPKSVSDCEQLTNSDAKDECYTNVAIETGDASLCEKTTKLKDACYFEVAVETKDDNLCEKIIATKGIYSRDRCYDAIARAIKDA